MEAANGPRALKMMRWAHRLDPWNAPYLARLSDAELRAGSFRGAIARQEQVVRTRRYFAPDHVRLGWFYWLANNPQGALAEFQYAVRLDRWDTTNGNVYTPLGLAHANLGQYGQALAAFSFGFQVSPIIVDDEAWLVDEASLLPVKYLDPVYLQRAQAKLPIDLQRNIVRRLAHGAPKPEQLPPVLNPDYRLTAVLDEMYRDYQARLSTDRDRAEVMLAILGRLAQETGLRGLAVSYLEELKELTPDEDAPHYSLGLAYMAIGETERAKEEFRTVIDIGDRTSQVLLRVPFSHFQLGVLALQAEPPDPAAAAGEFQDALDSYRWPYYPNLYSFLAIARGLQGERSAAEEAVQKELFLLGVDLDPPSSAPAADAEATQRGTSR
jgi:tetratricopeptide (TPR) repeat protein